MEKTLRVIGDVHGKYRQYKNLLTSNFDCSIQLGDMGFNYTPLSEFMRCNIDYFFRGNHDNYFAYSPFILDKDEKNRAGIIKDGIMEKDKIFFCGGAVSIDKDLRTPGIDWFDSEVMSYSSMLIHQEVWNNTTPRIMISHDAPETICRILAKEQRIYDYHPSIIQQFLDALLKDHKPEIWVFGHWHTSFKQTIGKTTFIGLRELEFVDINIQV